MTVPAAFEGHETRECGEHRTVGSHRAWCFDCSEWCYPDDELACKGCRIPKLEAALGLHHVPSDRVTHEVVEGGWEHECG